MFTLFIDNQKRFENRPHNKFRDQGRDGYGRGRGRGGGGGRGRGDRMWVIFIVIQMLGDESLSILNESLLHYKLIPRRNLNLYSYGKCIKYILKNAVYPFC